MSESVARSLSLSPSASHRYSNANQFRGYYSRDARCGHGVMLYGNVKEQLDTSTGRLEVEFNCLHEGGWLGGFMRAKGVNTFVKTGMKCALRCARALKTPRARAQRSAAQRAFSFENQSIYS